MVGNLELNIVTVQEFCKTYCVSKAKSEQLCLLNESVTAIGEEEYQNLLQSINFQKRRNDPVSYSTKGFKMQKIQNENVLALESITVTEDDEFEGETFPDILLTSELKDVPRERATAFSSQEIINSDETIQNLENYPYDPMQSNFVMIYSDDN